MVLQGFPVRMSHGFLVGRYGMICFNQDNVEGSSENSTKVMQQIKCTGWLCGRKSILMKVEHHEALEKLKQAKLGKVSRLQPQQRVFAH